MGYFPNSDPNAKADIMEELGMMAALDEQVLWFAQTFPRAYKDWPGLKEMRAFFCRGYRPADGQWAESEIFGESGIPRELVGNPPGKSNLLPESKPIALPPARVGEAGGISADLDMEKLVHELAQSTNMLRRPRTAEEIKADLYRPRVSGAKE